MKKTPLLIGLLVFTLFPLATAVTVDQTTFINIDNETYTFAHTMNFDRIVIGTTYLILNQTNFTIDTTNTANITFYELVDNETIGMITNTSLPSTVWFNISGFQTYSNYSLYLNNTYNQTTATNSYGNTSFNYTHSTGNRINLLLASTSQIRIVSSPYATDIITISNSVLTIVGVLLIIMALFAIIIMFMKWVK